MEEAIRADRAAGRTSPYRTDDDAVVRREDFAHDRATLTRPAFVRDIEKILNLPAYNRYADKTQVFSFAENDEISRRGLHVQLVSRGLGHREPAQAELRPHRGHRAGPRHGPHALRPRRRALSVGLLLPRAHRAHLQPQRALGAGARQPVPPQHLAADARRCALPQRRVRLAGAAPGRTATFEQLDNLVGGLHGRRVPIKTLRPSTLEGCVVRVADMIAYIGKDRQDALAMGSSIAFPFDSEAIGVTNAKIINNLTVDIVNNSYGKPEIAMSEEVFRDLKLAKKQNYEVIYLKEGMVDDTENLVEEMFEEMYARLLADLLEERQESPIFQHHVRRLAAASRSIVPAEYLAGEPDQIVVDYMASMTDSYFMAIYRHLFPESDRRIKPAVTAPTFRAEKAFPQRPRTDARGAFVERLKERITTPPRSRRRSCHGGGPPDADTGDRGAGYCRAKRPPQLLPVAYRPIAGNLAGVGCGLPERRKCRSCSMMAESDGGEDPVERLALSAAN